MDSRYYPEANDEEEEPEDEGEQLHRRAGGRVSEKGQPLGCSLEVSWSAPLPRGPRVSLRGTHGGRSWGLCVHNVCTQARTHVQALAGAMGKMAP